MNIMARFIKRKLIKYRFGSPFLLFACLSMILLIAGYASSFQTENIFLVIIDGVRYSETFGDETHGNIENIYGLSSEGCVNTAFYNDNKTKTLNGVSAIITGHWVKIGKLGEMKKSILNLFRKRPFFSRKPSLWEYYRKQLGAPQETCYYSFPYSEGAFFQPVSYHKEYGSNYWPMRGHFGSDREVWAELETVMDKHHPKLVVLYLGETDGAGHSREWERYIKAIQAADEIVGLLWQKIQSDAIYRDKTAMIVTNDHGRHDKDHGDFSDHGDDCEGCQHIMLLAMGPDFRKNYQINTKRTLIDIVPTIGKLLGFDAEYSTGNVMNELIGLDEYDIHK